MYIWQGLEIIARRVYALFQAFAKVECLADWKRPPNAPNELDKQSDSISSRGCSGGCCGDPR